EAGAEAYFGKPAKDLTLEEGMVLAGLIKSPEGDGVNGSPYDPTRHPDSAKERWDYIRQGMVDLKFITKEKADSLKYPTNVKPFDPKNDPNTGAQWGLDKPTGLIVHHVLDELSHAKDGSGNAVFPDIKDGGYKIITTINPNLQHAAELYASGVTKDSPLFGQPPNLQAALVAVEPRTGRVLAYYGGPNGSGNDYAGFYADPVLDSGDPTGVGRHPPGSSFKIYTLAAELIDGYSVNSYWDGTSPKEFPKSGRTKANPVRNASNANCQAGKDHCMLWEATEQSLNTPFYGVTETLGWPKVVDTAHAAGIRYLWNDKLERIDLGTTPPDQTHLSTEVGIGQYSVTVLDHANGVATIAARGWAAPEHFVQKVFKGTELRYAEQIKLTRIPGYTEAMADDENWVLQKVVKGNNLEGGRQAGAKSGTWQLGTSTTANAHAWWVGFTAPDPAKGINGLATAVWVGNKDKEQALKQTARSDTHVSYSGDMFGSTMPGPIWQRFMNA